MRHLITAMLLLVGIIHLLPLSGALGPERLHLLYGLSMDDGNLAILMRHRAVLFGLLGFFFVLAAFRASYQGLALVAGFVSVISFLWIAASVGDYNPHLARVVLADVVALVCLIIATGAFFWQRRRNPS